MALGGKHSLPGFEKSLEELREDILLMAALVREFEQCQVRFRSAR